MQTETDQIFRFKYDTELRAGCNYTAQHKGTLILGNRYHAQARLTPKVQFVWLVWVLCIPHYPGTGTVGSGVLQHYTVAYWRDREEGQSCFSTVWSNWAKCECAQRHTRLLCALSVTRVMPWFGILSSQSVTAAWKTLAMIAPVWDLESGRICTTTFTTSQAFVCQHRLTFECFIQRSGWFL